MTCQGSATCEMAPQAKDVTPPRSAASRTLPIATSRGVARRGYPVPARTSHGGRFPADRQVRWKAALPSAHGGSALPAGAQEGPMKAVNVLFFFIFLVV